MTKIEHREKFDRYLDAYLTMHRKTKWGGTHWSLPIPIEERAHKNALDFYEVDETSMEHYIGCTDWITSRAAIYAIEAVRALNGGSDTAPDALKLLELAVAEVNECLKKWNPETRCWKGADE
jgi:hypothetical protein